LPSVCKLEAAIFKRTEDIDAEDERPVFSRAAHNPARNPIGL
jgi:hypothetical protein